MRQYDGGRKWQKSIFTLHDTGSYVCAAACPCVIMHDITRMLANIEEHSDSRTCAAACISGMVDIPCLFCIGNSRERFVNRFFNNGENYEVEDSRMREEEEWNPENSSFDWWPGDWCRFYTMAAFESCCGWLCIGPNVSGANFPLIFSCMAGCIYPLCVCPISCCLRRLTLNRLQIRDEGMLHTCAVSTMCTPCSLVQMQEELQASSSSSSAYGADHGMQSPYTENSQYGGVH